MVVSLKGLPCCRSHFPFVHIYEQPASEDGAQFCLPWCCLQFDSLCRYLIHEGGHKGDLIIALSKSTGTESVLWRLKTKPVCRLLISRMSHINGPLSRSHIFALYFLKTPLVHSFIKLTWRQMCASSSCLPPDILEAILQFWTIWHGKIRLTMKTKQCSSSPGGWKPWSPFLQRFPRRLPDVPAWKAECRDSASVKQRAWHSWLLGHLSSYHRETLDGIASERSLVVSSRHVSTSENHSVITTKHGWQLWSEVTQGTQTGKR